MKKPKNLILVKCALILGIVFVITNCKKDREPCEKNSPDKNETSAANRLANFGSEDNINLTPHIMSQGIGNDEINGFSQNFSTSEASELDALIDSIGPDDFDPLLDSAIAKRNSHTGSCTNFITALKFCYGLNPDKTQIKLLYQPVFYCRTNYNPTTKIASYEVVNPSPDVFYVYDRSSGSFVLASSTEIACIARYKNNMLLRHGAAAEPLPFSQTNSNDNLKDVEAVYYSFQEIAALIADNNDSYLKIYNASKTVDVEGNPVNKHDLLLAPAYFSSAGTSAGSFLNCFADLAHLCPPNCATGIFTLD